MTGNLSVSFEGDTCSVTGHGRGYRLRGAAVTVCRGFDGAVTVLRDGRELPVRLLAGGGEPLPVEDGKSVRQRVDLAKAEQQSFADWKPAPDHLWRRGYKPEPTPLQSSVANANSTQDQQAPSPRLGSRHPLGKKGTLLN